MPTLPPDDPRWTSLNGGYQLPFDARPALRKLATSFADDGAWQELWNDLHHQGDLGEASYVTIPNLVAIGASGAARGWNFYALTGLIELERHRHTNPPIPDWLAELYIAAWQQLVRLALADLAHAVDPLVIRSALSVVALGRGDLRLGALIADLDASEIDEHLRDHLSWDELYDESRRPFVAG